MRKLFLLVRCFYLVFLVALLLCSLAFALLQTKWAKEKIGEIITKLCAQSGIELKLGLVDGSLPFTWHVEQIYLKWGADEKLCLHDVKLRFAILPLFNKNVVLSYFNVEKAHFAFSSQSSSHTFTLDEAKVKLKQLGYRLSIPYRLVVKRLKINSLSFENLTSKHTALYFLVADADLGKHLRHFQSNLMISPRGHPDNALQFNVFASQKLKFASIGLIADLSSLEPFYPVYASLPHCGMDIDISLMGAWANWKAFFNNEPMPSSLSGVCKANLHPHNGPPLLERPWTIHAKYGIETFHGLSIYSSSLHSDIIDASLRADIEKNLEDSVADLCFSIPDLSLLADYDLHGSARGELSYAQLCCAADLFLENMEYKRTPLEPVNIHVGAYHTEEGWEGHGSLKTQGGNHPINSTLDFRSEPDQLSLKGISLSGPGILLAGDLSIDLHHFLYKGALYGQIDDLHHFAFLLDKNRVNASVGIECQFSEDLGKQNVRCSILGKNFLFNTYSIEQFSLTTSLSDLFSKPQGKFHLFAQGLHSPLFDIDRVDFATSSKENEEWPFLFHIEGNIEEPFSIDAQGLWKKDLLLHVETTALSGEIFSYPINLNKPCVLEKSKQFFSLSPLHITIGESSVLASCDLNKVRSTAQIQMEHFPLKLLSLFYPSHALTGALSLSGYFDATEKNVQGNLNAALEEIQFQHFDKKEPFKAKGSLQAHMDQGVLQTQGYLSAIKDQFIDFSATLPLSYTVFPFHLGFNANKPICAELIAEGRIQDLFDFINLGMHRATGFISSRLFLSQTLNSPALQGSIEWQAGTYENYLTGTALKDIHALFQANSHQLDLASFSAKDDKKGTVLGTGVIELNPQDHFPYRFRAELDNLHTVHFNPVDCNLTGALNLSGNMKEAILKGNLLVPQAEFKIPDQLPFDIPVLPVTYLNTSGPLSLENLMPRPAFPFQIQLELTAEEPVRVNGKGLNSEWKGTLFLHGANTHIRANGNLELIKGEFALFGKTFKLVEGQIIFNEKPTPSATINLSGNLHLADTIITAHLRGSLSSPILTFQSNPQMSTSAILARILFNKDISDISQPEALQLATALISLSGGAGPSVLETIRKNIGVDRLAIGSQTDHPDEIAVQIGKYLTKGVLITLSQSATSSQVIVEVEFNYGFIFQAETQEEQEGKFSLKWTHSY